MSKVIYILISFFICIQLTAQEVYERLTIDVLLGGDKYINGWESGHKTDLLINPTETSFRLKARLNYYFHENWGIHGDVQIGITRNTGNKKDQIPSPFTDEYVNDYYIEGPKLITDRENIYGVLSLGAQYRFELKKWSFIPRLSFGVAHIAADNCNFIIKGKGTNEQHLIEYYVKNNKSDEYGLISRAYLNPGIQIGYKFRHIHLIAELGYIQYLKKLNYIYKKSELYMDGQEVVEEFPSMHTAKKIEFNLGVTIPVSWRIK